jgi:energy-coupling factor transport system permease protein
MLIALSTSNPAYKAAVLGAALVTLCATARLAAVRRLLSGVALVATFDALLNFVSAHLGTTVLFSIPDPLPALGGRYTLEALAFGVSSGLTIAAAILAAAPFSLLLRPQDVMDALPAVLSRSGVAIAASMTLVPTIAASFVEVGEAQRMRGWRPRGPRSWAEVVVPVMLTTAEGSLQLAESMEARGFGAGPRTSFRKPALTPAGWAVVAASAGAAVAFAAMRSLGWASDWQPYPTFGLPDVNPWPLLACAFLLFPAVLWRRRRV